MCLFGADEDLKADGFLGGFGLGGDILGRF